MKGDLPCQIHNEQIKTLFKRTEELTEIQKTLHSLDKTLALQSQLLQTITEHNQKQDKRMDKQQEVIEKININLTEIAEGQKNTNKELKSLGSRMDKVESRVKENENKHTIDTRDLDKKRYTDLFFKYGLPFGGALVILELLRFWRG